VTAVSDLEGMINGILSNPDEMKKIIDMAGKIMNTEGNPTAQSEASGSYASPSLDSILNEINANPGGLAKAAENLLSGGGGLQGLLGGGGIQNLLGGGFIQKILGSSTIQRLISSPVVQNLASGGLNTKNDKRELFDALKPYLSEERSYKLERAVMFAKVMRVAGVAGAAALKKGG